MGGSQQTAVGEGEPYDGGEGWEGHRRGRRGVCAEPEVGADVRHGNGVTMDVRRAKKNPTIYFHVFINVSRIKTTICFHVSFFLQMRSCSGKKNPPSLIFLKSSSTLHLPNARWCLQHPRAPFPAFVPVNPRDPLTTGLSLPCLRRLQKFHKAGTFIAALHPQHYQFVFGRKTHGQKIFPK